MLSGNRVDATDRILELVTSGGGEGYFGEPVTQLEHALQTAALAEVDGAPDALVVAALLHDIGHFVADLEGVSRPVVDARHEYLGQRWLASHFNRAVTEPIRLHVAAKRYLCSVNMAYVHALTRASQESLTRQGGPMRADEVTVFLQTPWARDAVFLRRWDDAAKVPGKTVPGLSYYRGVIERMLEAW
jgi:phosphonate degradation associated HDIG domain protein